MAPRKIEIKRIENNAKRKLSFCQRRKGLMKKASELSVLCEAEVAVIVFSDRGRAYNFSSNDIKSTTERYIKARTENSGSSFVQDKNAQFYQQESKKLQQQIDMLQNTNRYLTGEGCSLNAKELEQMENRLEQGIARIKSKKEEMILGEIESSKKRTMELENEYACLQAKIAENDKLQQLTMIHSQEYNAIHAFLAQNLHNSLDTMETKTTVYHPFPEKKSLLGKSVLYLDAPPS